MKLMRRWIGQLRNEFDLMPWLMRLGLVILVIGGALDIAFHASPASWIPLLEPVLGKEGYNAHLVTLVGMIITLIGLFVGIWSIHLRRAHTSRG